MNVLPDTDAAPRRPSRYPSHSVVESTTNLPVPIPDRGYSRVVDDGDNGDRIQYQFAADAAVEIIRAQDQVVVLRENSGISTLNSSEVYYDDGKTTTNRSTGGGTAATMGHEVPNCSANLKISKTVTQTTKSSSSSSNPSPDSSRSSPSSASSSNNDKPPRGVIPYTTTNRSEENIAVSNTTKTRKIDSTGGGGGSGGRKTPSTSTMHTFTSGRSSKEDSSKDSPPSLPFRPVEGMDDDQSAEDDIFLPNTTSSSGTKIIPSRDVSEEDVNERNLERIASPILCTSSSSSSSSSNKKKQPLNSFLLDKTTPSANQASTPLREAQSSSRKQCTGTNTGLITERPQPHSIIENSAFSSPSHKLKNPSPGLPTNNPNCKNPPVFDLQQQQQQQQQQQHDHNQTAMPPQRHVVPAQGAMDTTVAAANNNKTQNVVDNAMPLSHLLTPYIVDHSMISALTSPSFDSAKKIGQLVCRRQDIILLPLTNEHLTLMKYLQIQDTKTAAIPSPKRGDERHVENVHEQSKASTVVAVPVLEEENVAIDDAEAPNPRQIEVLPQGSNLSTIKDNWETLAAVAVALRCSAHETTSNPSCGAPTHQQQTNGIVPDHLQVIGAGASAATAAIVPAANYAVMMNQPEHYKSLPDHLLGLVQKQHINILKRVEEQGLPPTKIPTQQQGKENPPETKPSMMVATGAKLARLTKPKRVALPDAPGDWDDGGYENSLESSRTLSLDRGFSAQ